MFVVIAIARRFEHAVNAVIVANIVVLVAGLIVGGPEHELFETVDFALLWFFAAELGIRVWMARLGFFRSWWNTADAIIILMALLPVAGGGIAVLRLARLARLAHLARHTSHLG